MRNRFARIRKLLNRAEKAMQKQSMRVDIQKYFDTGVLPESEPAKSFVDLMAAFDRMTDASVGGDDYEQAAGDYERAVKTWEQAEIGIQWT